ncbi:MAG: SLBB domain-containing protein [Armatimonadota bacterium]|nr:SLBB domain-containing protein [Armatimonadota bacterium]
MRQPTQSIEVCKRLSRLSILAAAVCLLLASSPAFADTSYSYRLGPEDVVTLTVMGHPEFSGEFLIPTDGSLTLPSIGAVKAAGMTLDELAATATQGLKERLKSPEVTVSLRTPRMQRIYVLGAVNTPGQFDVKPGWRIAEAIAAAGGLTPRTEPADCEAVILRSATDRKEVRNLGEVMRGDSEANLPVESGDVLTIDAGETLPVYVMGRVTNPGLYRIRKAEAGVLEALTLAGGTMEDAAISAIRITRLSGASETVNLTSSIVDSQQTSKVKLQSGDLVLVPETKARVAVLGYVTQPGFYPLKDGQKLMLSDALGLAKGVDNRRGQMGAIAIVRTENGKQQNMVFDMNRFLKKGDASQNPEIKPGDVVYVAETRKPELTSILQAVSTAAILINPFIR